MTWEFDHMIEQAQRDAKAAESRQQAAQEREEAQRAAHQEWLRQILHKAPLMAKTLTKKGEPTDIELTLRRWQEARKGLRRRVTGEWVEEPYMSGWTAVQDIESYSTEGSGPYGGTFYGVRGVLLSPNGKILGYRGGVDSFIWNRLRDAGEYRVKHLTAGGVKELTPQEPWPNRKGIGSSHYYFLPDAGSEYYGHFTLEDILKKLAAFVVEHRIDPSTLSDQ